MGNASELKERQQQRCRAFLLYVKRSSFVGKIKPEKSKDSLNRYTPKILAR